MLRSRTTYCGNVHPASDLDEWIETVTRFGAEVAVGRADFGLGVWWNADVVAHLASDSAAFDRVRRLLEQHDLRIETLNVFPYGDFHGSAVKSSVYSPDWADEARLEYTRGAAEVAAFLLANDCRTPRDGLLPLSTLPLGFDAGTDLRLVARNLARAASALAAIEESLGIRVVLALEPEPFCLCERVSETVEFLVERVFSAPDSPVPEDVLRRHLGVCIDLCHLAVVGEDPLLAWDELTRAGIAIPKVQVSSGLELREPATELDRLLAFEEPRYLHQTVSFDGGLRALDLEDVRRRRAEFETAEGLRTHFHLPVFWDDPGPLGSTRAQVERFLRGFSARQSTSDGSTTRGAVVLEVETYTWDVLDADWRPERDLVQGIRCELEFVDALLRPDAP